MSSGGEVRYKKEAIFIVRFHRFYGIIQFLEDPRQKIHEIFEILIQILADIQRFRSLNIFAVSRQLSFVLSPKNAQLTLESST
jgi:hypothetical protein